MWRRDEEEGSPEAEVPLCRRDVGDGGDEEQKDNNFGDEPAKLMKERRRCERITTGPSLLVGGRGGGGVSGRRLSFTLSFVVVVVVFFFFFFVIVIGSLLLASPFHVVVYRGTGDDVPTIIIDPGGRRFNNDRMNNNNNDDNDDNDDDEKDCSSSASSSPRSRAPPPVPPNARRKPGVLNVHIVPHTHDDVGWLKTVDQYFVGSNSSIQQAAVRHIITGVVDALEKDPAKTFTYVEMAFFARWWREQTEERRDLVRDLVSQERLSFANGGWCMHDEAAAHYADMIDQTARGHEFIRGLFGGAAAPRVGWQLDPFGHSATQATHLGSGVGFEAVFFGRADQDDVDARSKRRAMEFTWRGSASLGEKADVFGFILSRYGNYGPPPGHCYDQVCADPLWQDDPSLEDYNVPVMVRRFEAAVAEQADWFQGSDGDDPSGYGGDVMLTMGTDFTYSAAPYWFEQLDSLIKNVNRVAGDRLNVFYSNPGAFLDAKKANPNMTWPVKSGDFFPYKWDEHQYWTGYYTSRPTLKRFIRRGGEYLRAARSLVGTSIRSTSGIDLRLKFIFTCVLIHWWYDEKII